MATRPEALFGPVTPMPGVSQPFAMAGGEALGPDLGAFAPPMLPSSGSPPQSDALATMRASVTDPAAPPVESAIDKLGPESEKNKQVLSKLNAMFTFSQSKMKNHYSRWNLNELKVQAYVPMQDYDRIVDVCRNRNNLPPEPISVVVPYTYATLHAAATFMSSVLLGRKPVFPLMAVRGTMVDIARNMELALQSNLDASRGQEALWQHIWDSLIYSFSCNRNAWEERTGQAIRWIGGKREMTTETTFAGNVLSCIDPYRFFPDPRVPIHECNVKGDFIFTEMELSELVLKDMEAQGLLKWVKEGLQKAGRETFNNVKDSQRRIKIGGEGMEIAAGGNVTAFRTLREGTVRLVPKDWGLGTSTNSELWKFTWLGTVQVLQAEPLGMVHGMHPYSATEPTSLGHDFMSLSMADMIGTFQDIISWLVTSRMENVRASINNQFVADPARVDVNDIRSSAIGRVIRLKQAAMGLPINDAIRQLIVQDVTQGHLADLQTMRVLADTITGVNDNLRGIQTAGGRRSATEARIAMQSGASRLSSLAIRVSSQSFQPMVLQMISNIQQFMPDEMWVETTGDDGQQISSALSPDRLCGSFNFQISDGSLPYDKTAMVEVWKEIMFGIAQDPELRAGWDLNKIFEYTAELGGAKNISSFKKQQMALPAPAGAMADPAAAGMAPVGAAMPAGPISASEAALAFAGA